MKRRLGFTIIEVSLFLAISALLFVGIAAGTGVNVARQRYNNAVEDYVEFLRRLYSQTEDTQNGREGTMQERFNGYCTIASNTNVKPIAGSNIQQSASDKATTEQGRTNCAIYGKIAIFNEQENDESGAVDNDQIMVYDVIGDIVDNENRLPKEVKSTLDALLAVHAEFLALEENSSGTCNLTTAGGYYSYTPDWSSHIETEQKGKYWTGAVMVIRSPIDGTIHTFVLDLNNLGNRYIRNPIPGFGTAICGSTAISQATQRANNDHAYLAAYFPKDASPSFKENETTNFCVNSDDSYAYNGRRRNVRIKPGGTNSSAVELIEFDSGDNACK